MTVTLANDLTQLHDGDTSGIGEFAFDGSVFKSGQTSIEGFVEGTGCIEIRVNQAGQGFMGWNFAATITTLADHHLLVWFRESFEYDTWAAHGMHMGIAADLGALPADYGSWQTQGSDRSIACYDGWVRAVINPYLAFQVTQGTPPARTSFTHGFTRMQMEASGRDVAMFDSYDFGGVNTITGGTVAAPGTFAQIATADRAATLPGGLWKNKIGIYFVTLKTIFGDVGTAESNITDTNQTVVYEYNRVQAHIQEIECVGNSTSILNKVLLGTITGTGVDEVGAAGINFINAGEVPNHFRADDANCDEMRLAGCNFLGPVATYAEAFMTHWSFTASAFVDETEDINEIAGTSFNDGAVGSYYAFGHAAPFDSLSIQASGHAGTPVVTWEYSTGTSTWADLPNLTDGTGNLDITGTNTVTYSIPADWVPGTLNSVSRYYIRARYTTAASAGGNLTGLGTFPVFTGRVRLEQSNVKCISSNFTNMGTISIKNGAFFKKCSVVDSLSPAKNAALDFADTDPAADTVRDIIINGGVNGIAIGDVTRFFNAGAAVDKGGGKVGIPDTAHGFADGQSILIAGTTNYNGTFTVDATSSANEIVITATFVSETFAITDSAVPNTTYNLRNISFTGLTDSVYLEFPATSTVTLNLLEGTTAMSAPDVNNVNSSTLVINNSVQLEVSGVTEGTAIKVVANETVGSITKGDVLLTGFADSNGALVGGTINYEGAFDPSGLDVIVRARNQGIAVAAIAEDGGAFVDETTEASSQTTADMTLLPTVPVANDAYNFGHDTQFTKLRLDISTALAFSGQPTIVWEYWNGAWVALSGVVDGTSGFETAGDNIVSWTLPGDWATTTINAQGPLFYVRARLSVLGTITTVPVGSRVTLNTQRYLPYAAERIIVAVTGLADIAAWTEDNISTFEVT